MSTLTRVRGINVFILASQSYRSAYWLTYKEASHMIGVLKLPPDWRGSH
jgi:hypothetical protein